MTETYKNSLVSPGVQKSMDSANESSQDGFKHMTGQTDGVLEEYLVTGN